MPAMFDYSQHMANLIDDISRRCSEFEFVDTRKILVGISRARNRSRHGLRAKLMPLKFRGGLRTGRIGKSDYYEMPRVIHEGREILYVLYFCLPRFQNLSFKAKMTTIFHELYHINPDFNGDIRRFPGRFYQHSHSEREYDRIVGELSSQYLKSLPDKSLTGFLKHSFEDLRQIHGEVGGLRVYVPEPALLQPRQALLFEQEQRWSGGDK
jgi:hypothetical protein